MKSMRFVVLPRYAREGRDRLMCRCGDVATLLRVTAHHQVPVCQTHARRNPTPKEST